MTTEEMIKYDQIIGFGIATPEELNLVKNIMGSTWNNVIDMVCSVRTGYKTFEQWLENEMEEGE